jgi:hypothetical protein
MWKPENRGADKGMRIKACCFNWRDRKKEPRICMCIGKIEKGGDGYGTGAMEAIG